MRKLRLILLLLVVVVAAIVLPPAIFLGRVWLHDGAQPLPPIAAGADDASRQYRGAPPKEIIVVAKDPAEAERQLVTLVRRAAAEHLKISVVGAHHSMGGHTIYPGGIALDLAAFNQMALDEKTKLLTVGSGARWWDIIPYLDHRGYSVAVMQTNSDFSVGGSISVNCHGWTNDEPPIAGTVESFRLLTAAGGVVRCSRTENRELFSLALGGYGLFGIILDVQLRVVPNEYYVATAERVKPEDYVRRYHELTRGRTDVGMAYGRINVAPDSFMEDGIVTLLKRQPGDRPTKDTLTDEKPSLLKRLVFRGGIGSDYGKNLRWRLETMMGETAGKLLSRNQVMNEPSNLYATRNPQTTDILHEYFIPAPRFADFVTRARPILKSYKPELLNITIRNVEPDQDVFLRYATEEVFGLVLLFHQERTTEADTRMQALTRELIDAALASGGRYYLPYRPHATQEQFLKAYPQAKEFFAAKLRYDPAEIFENSFYVNYGKPTLAGGVQK